MVSLYQERNEMKYYLKWNTEWPLRWNFFTGFNVTKDKYTTKYLCLAMCDTVEVLMRGFQVFTDTVGESIGSFKEALIELHLSQVKRELKRNHFKEIR
jgi:hypothetical protein